MATIEVPQAVCDRVEAVAAMTKRTASEVIESAIAAYGITPARGLGFDSALLLLACQSRDVLRIYGWIQDKVLTPAVVQRLGEYAEAQGQDFWLPGCGGHEVICRTRLGQEYLYCWNPGKGEHAYYLIGEDRFVPDGEFKEAV